MITAEKVSEHLIHQIKTSNLNFLLHETPFSAQITIKKRFVNKFSRSEPAAPIEVLPKIISADESIQSHRLDQVIEGLKSENCQLNVKLDKSEKDNKHYREIIAELEGRLEKAEKDLFTISKRNKTNIDEKVEEIKVLKSVIKKNNEESSTTKKELTQANRNVKSKERDIFNLEKNKLSQFETIKNLKENLNELRKDKKNLENNLKHQEKKAKKKESSTRLENRLLQQQNNLACDICHEYFETLDDLNTHMKANHTLKQPKISENIAKSDENSNKLHDAETPDNNCTEDQENEFKCPIWIFGYSTGRRVCFCKIELIFDKDFSKIR